jgi:nucleoside-diphosphate-sugar epimerase
MATLFCFGFGYSAQHWLDAYGHRFERICATATDAKRAAELNAEMQPGFIALAFDGVSASNELLECIGQAGAVLTSVPPDSSGDPVLNTCGEALARARLRSVVYLSSVGVYGNYDGGWVDEESECHPVKDHNARRLAAERAWRDFGARAGVPVAILRLAGIYGPGRSALDNVRRGTARRIAKPGQVFNRIHVADVAQAIDAAFAARADGIFNVTDDEPTASGDLIVFAAALLGIEPPLEISFAEARKMMSEFAASFYTDVKRVRNAKLKSALGVTLKFPTYREGLAGIYRDDAKTGP